MGRMTASEWKKKKEEEIAQGTSRSPASTAASPYETTASVDSQKRMTPSEWKEQKASTSFEWWVKSSIGLLDETQAKTKNWSYSAEHDTYSSRASSLLASADGWRKKYAGNDEALAYIDSIVDSLSSYKQIGGKYKDYYSQYESQEMFDVYQMSGDEIWKKVKSGERVAYTTNDGQEITWKALYDSKSLNDRYAYYSSLDDWEEMSKGAKHSTDMASDWNIVTQLKFDQTPSTWEEAQRQGYTKEYYDRKVAERDEKRAYISQKYGIDFNAYDVQDKLGRLSTELESKKGEMDTFLYWDDMDEEELAVLNYIFNTQGRDSALAWHQSREDTYEERHLQQMQKKWQEFGQQHAFWASVGSLGTNVLSGIEWLVDSGVYLATGEMDENRMAMRTNAARSGVMDTIDSDFGDFLYSTAMSGVDSALSMAMFGGTGGAISQGLGAAAQGTQDALDRGLSSDQAFMAGVVSGTAETVFEKFSIGNFKALQEVPAYTLKGIAKNIAISMGVNATEEMLTEIANITYDTLAHGDLAHYTREDLKNGAFGSAVLQVLEAGASGALMGFGFGAVGSAGNALGVASSQIADSKRMNALAEGTLEVDGGKEALLNFAHDVAGSSSGRTQSKIEKLSGKVESNATTKNVKQLYKAVSTATNSQNKADIVKSLERKGVSSREASIIADSIIELSKRSGITSDNVSIMADDIAEAAFGADPNKKAQKLLESGKVQDAVKTVLNDIALNEKSTMGQRNQKINDLATDVKAGLFSRDTGVSLDVAKEVVKGNRNALKESLAESKYEVSAEGKNLDKQGNEVSIIGVESNKDGKLILKTENGTIDASEVSFATQDEAIVYSAISNMDISAESAWAIIKGFNKADGVSAQLYAIDIPLAYKYGKLNYKAGLQNLSITPSQSAVAFQMGRSDAEASVESTSQESTESTISEKNADKEIIFDGFTYSNRKANKVQKASMAAIELVNKMSSLEVHVYQSVKENGNFYALVDGKKRIAPNGYFRDGNKIYIDINAGKDGRGVMLFTMSHEIGHYIAENNAADFKAISDFLFEHYGPDAPIDSMLKDKKARVKESYKRDGKPIPSEAQLEKEAHEELVCDMLSRMLADQYAYDKLMELKQDNLRAFQKLGEAIKKFLDKIAKLIGVYDTQVTDFQFAASVETFGEEAFRQLQDLYIKAFVKADANFQTTQEQVTIGNVTINNQITMEEDVIDSSNTGIAKETKTGVKMQERTEFEAQPKQVFRVSTKNGKAESKMLGTNKSVKELRDARFQENGFSKEEVKKINGFIKEMADNMAKYRLKYKFVGLQNIHDAKIILNPMTGKIVLSAMVNNSDYSVNFDFTKICKKRVALQEVLETLAREKGKVTDGKVTEVNLSPTNIKRINDILASYGVETACLCCFVESKRYNIQNYYQEKVVDVWNKLVDEVAPEAGYFNFADSGVDTSKIPDSEFADLEVQMKEWAGKTGKAKDVEQKMREFLADAPAARKKLRFADLVTANGRTNLHKLYPEIESLILSKLGQSAPKSVEAFTPYNGEIDLLEAKGDGDIIKYLYDIAGVRSQSFSDFMIAHVFDVLQKTASMSARKMPAHVYTKEIARAMLFGMTGEKHNLSVLHNVDPNVDSWNAGLSKDGEYNFSDYEAYKKGYSEFVQSIGWKDAVKLQNTEGYSKDCGIIGVGFSYNHMLKLHNDPEVRQVIGYHTSQMPVEVKPLTHLDKAADYTEVQNTKSFAGFAKPNYAIPDGVPSYATPPQDVIDKDSKTPKTTKVSDTFDIIGTFKKLSEGKTGDARTAAAKETLRQLLEYANDHGYVLRVAPGEAGKGNFNLYEDVQKTQNPYLTTDHYIEYCIERGMLPMFFEFSMNPNYYKDIFDFNVFDRKSYNPETGLHEDSDGRKAYAPQTAVHMLNEDGSLAFPENFFDIVDKQMSNYNSYMQDVDSKMPSIMDEVRSVTNSTSKMSDRDTVKFADRTLAEELTPAKYNALLNKKPIRTSKKDWAKVNEARMSQYSRMDESDIPDLDIFSLAEYGKLNEGYLYFVRNYGKDQFVVVGKKLIIPEKRTVIREEQITHGESDSRKKTYPNDGRDGSGRGADAGDSERSGNRGKLRENDTGAGKNEQTVQKGDTVYGTSDSRTGIKLSDRDDVPTFYSQMAKVVDGLKQEKHGASSVVSTLRNKGVKAEEIKWSGIEAWLEGKKSVTKAELQEFIAGSMLQIEEEILDNKDRPYTEDQQKRLDEYEAKRDEVAKRLADAWKKITGDEFPIRNTGADLESAVVNKIIDANKEHKDASFEGRLLKKLRKDLQEVIENNDDFGFDNWRDALRSIHRHRRDFISHYEMSTNDKAVIVKYCNALNAYNELPNKFSDADTERLRSIARETEPWNRKIMEVKHEYNEESAKHMTNWGQYRLEGGKNYREMLFRIPGSTYTNEAMMTHWKDRKGVLAHARVQDMDTFLGKMLFVEEIQSDWHNAGRKDGYRDPNAEDKYTLSQKMNKYTEEFFASPIAAVVRERIGAIGYEGAGVSMILNYLLDATTMQSTLDMLSRRGASFTESEVSEIAKYASEYLDMYNKWQTAPGDLTAPDAPFKENYHEYVLKRLLREAAEQDYDSIGWTTAETQDERWKNNMPHKEGTGKSGFLKAYTNEYDHKIRKFLDRFGEKFGSKVGKTTLDNGTEVWSMAITDSMKESVMTEGQALYSDRDDIVIEKPSDNKYIKMVEDGATHIGEYDVVPKSKEPKKTILAWKALVVKPGAKNNPKDKSYGNMYPPQVHQVASTPYGVWLYANNAPKKLDKDGNPELTKFGRPKVKEGMTYRPAWHFGDAPYASQFKTTHGFFDDNGVQRFYMAESKGILVWALCELAADENYQDEADMAGHVGEDRVWDEQQASLWYLPENGYYKYMTNRVDPNSVTWYLSDKMRIVQTITDAEMRDILTWIKEDGSTDLEFNYPLRLDGKDVNPADYGIPVGNVVGDGIDYVDRWKNQFREIAMNGDIDITQSHFYYVPSTATNYGSYETVSFSKEVDDHSQELLKTKKDAKIVTINPSSTSAATLSFESSTGVNVKEAKTMAGRKKIIEAARKAGYDIVEFAKAGKDLGVDVVIINPDSVIRDYKFNNVSERHGRTDSVKYQDRAEDSVSNRSLLANAFEGLAQNDAEKNKIQEYKSKIALIDAEEKKLRELNAQIKELSFANGPRDTKRIKSLQFDANQAANRINTYDKQLLRLEASKPLQDVLAREKKRAYKKAEQEGKKALAKQREKAAETQRALLEKWQDSRKKAVENREKTAMRHKIQRVVGELNDLLLSNDKKRHVPENLKKAVADALTLVNMDTVGAEERAAKYAALIAKETDPDKIDAYTVTMENILRQGEKMGQRLKELRDAYEEISESDDPDIANAYDPVIAGSLKELAASVGNTSLRNMTIEQLQDVYDMYKMVLTRVRDANKAFLNARNESIGNLASRVVGEVRKVRGERKYRVALLDAARAFSWNNLKPVYAMERIGSSTLIEAFKNVRAGEDTWAKDVGEARDYYLDKSKKHGYDSWDFDKKYTFKSTSDLEFELTLEQIMSLYAYSKREQSLDHLRLGGFVFDSNIETYKEKDGKTGKSILKYKVNTAEAHQISIDILAEITGKLSSEQKSFVDDMQEYLSTVMGAKGNEVTMQMYGVKLFKEKFYFPLKSAKQFMFEQNQVAGEVRIKNSGFTNKVVAHANNPVILNSFMDVWADHVNDMSMYHSFVLPLEDFNRIFNYKSPKQEGQPPVSVKGTIQGAYSPAAVDYVKQLITDLNGGARSDPRETPGKKLVAMFKKAKVFTSLSVVIQQFSAIGRAYALVDPKYFRPTKNGMNHGQLWEEIKNYAPVAAIKEMGYFDTDMGLSTREFIKAKEYADFKEKAKGFVQDGNYRDEVLSRLPAWADEVTWCAIWNAVKRESVSTHKDLRPGSEEFLKAAGERFTEVITKTQVYDSVLARSANMRSKGGMMSMVTSFMAEPTTAINMLEDAILKGKRGDKKYASRAFAAVAVSVILNNALSSIIYAMRDDDEDETFLEKYAQAFVSGMLDDLNPLTYYPYLKDVWSLFQGYDIERADMSLISDFVDASKGLVKAYTDEDGDVVGAWHDFAGTVLNLGGVPAANIHREVNGGINFVKTLIADINGRATTWRSMGDALQATVQDSTPIWGWFPDKKKSDNLYDAIIKGDTAYVDRLKGSYKDDDAYHNAVRKALRDNDPRIKEAAQAQIDGDPSERVRIARLIIADGFDQDDVVMAINAEVSDMKPDGEKSEPKKKGFYTAEDFAVEISNGDQASAYAVKEDIITTAQKNGKSKEEAEKSFASSAKSELKDFVMNGEISESKAVNALVTFCGMTEDDAKADVQYWAFKRNYPDVFAEDSWFDKYYEDVADSGISIDMYMEYRNQVKSMTGEDKKEKRMAVIHSLPISNAQKDALYYAEGWAASKLWQAPWH